MTFDQIVGNGISGVLILQIFPGVDAPDPPRKPRTLAARNMTYNFWLASPLIRRNIILGPVVQSWISANPGLKFNLLFLFMYFCTSICFKTSEKKIHICPDKISEEIFPSV
jgi:hypothetical protein